MPDNSPIFEEQTLTSDMSNFLEEWGLPLEGDIQESFKSETPPSAMQQLEESQPSPTMTREQGIQELTQMQQSEGYVPAKVDQQMPMQHTVEQGDTLWGIGQMFGLDPQKLAEINQVDDPRKLQIGQVLDLVGLTSAPPVEPSGFIGQQDTGVMPPVAPTTTVPEPTKEYSTSMFPTSVRLAKDHLIGAKTSPEGAIVKTEEYFTKAEHEVITGRGIHALKRALKGKLDKVIDSKFIKHKASEAAKGNPLYVVDGKDSNFVIIPDDYDDIGKQAIGYNTPVTEENLADPAYNVKMGLSTVRLFRHNGNVYGGDEMNTPPPDYSHELKDSEVRLSKKDVLDRIITIFKEWDEGKFKDKDDTKLGTAKGLFHRFSEAFGPDMGESFSARILLGGKKKLGLSQDDFDKIPTYEEYLDFMIKTGQLSEGHPSIGWGRETGAEPQTKTKSFGDYFGGEIAVEMGELENQLSGMPKEDLMTVLSFMPIPAIAGAAVPIKAIQAWLKRHGATKYQEMGRGTQFPLGAEEKGLLPQVRDFVQSIFMQKGMEKALKKGVRYGGEAGRDFVVKGPITQKELRILTDATAKSKKKYDMVGADPAYHPTKAYRAKPIYMKFRGKKVEVDDLAEIEDEIKRKMFSEVKVGDIIP